MAQFINPRTIGYPTCCDQPTAVVIPVPVISSYDWLDPEAYMGRFDDDPYASWSYCYEEHLPTCPRIGAVASLSDELPHLDPLPAHVWEHTYSTYYAGYNRTDLY